MLSYLKRKLEKRKIKRTFKEYGYRLKSFSLKDLGSVEYAQWEHPFEGEKEITDAQVSFFGELLSEGGFAVDIGAHTGDTTVPMALAAGKTGAVLGLEPNPFVFKILQKNAALNTETTRIIPECYAATETPGTFTFQYSDASFCNGGYLDHIESNNHKHHFELEVEGRNLSKELEERYAEWLPHWQLLKVDAEGYDKDIIKSLSDILIKYKPNLLVECYKRLTIDERNDLYHVITQLGYDLYFIDGFEINAERVLLDAASMLDRKHFEMLALPKEA
jgi:FkbM family methyltransferase